MTKDRDNWEDDEEDLELIPDHEAEDAIANSYSSLRIKKTLDNRVIISASTPKKDTF